MVSDSVVDGGNIIVTHVICERASFFVVVFVFFHSWLPAERLLVEGAKQPGFLLQLLQLIDNGAANESIRQAAAVFFKNTVKAAWDESKDLEDRKGVVISPQDRNTIKTNLVELMCTVPPRIQSQISEAISIIAAIDYPDNWNGLLPALIAKFGSPDLNVVNGVLMTADSIFKGFRHVQRSDDLYRIIIFSLDRIQEPLLVLFSQVDQAVDSSPGDAAQLKLRMESLRLITSIYFSLVYQDLPAYFEDHMKEWMTGFSKYLQYKNPILVDNDEEDEPGPIDKLQAAIIDVLKLFAERDEEPFQVYLPDFTKIVWNLLTSLTKFNKHDQLVVISTKYLNVLVGRAFYRHLFEDESTLRQIVSHIVIPNLMVRESDEENFEDNPQEFIMTELEGSDNESRRRCSRELLGAMCRQFEAQTTAICSDHIKQMIAEFAADPNNKWIAKDTAISLFLGITIKKESSYGVSELNQGVNLMEFFSLQILPELQDNNPAQRPMVKATALNFVCIFRNQFTKEQLITLMPLLIAHLGSSFVVVHSLAANTIEQIERLKDSSSGTMQEKITRQDIEPFLQNLFTALFHIVDNTDLNENEYVMKCIMRTLDKIGDGVVPVKDIVFEKLSAALERVCKNPRTPGFNHNLFESIAILVKSVCSSDPSKVTEMEQMLFPPFQHILQMDILEFTPYVFQILAQLLEFRPEGTGIGEAYSSLFPPLLTASLWEKTGNVPGLTRLIQAYLKRAAADLVAAGHLTPMLGIFQKLNASKATESSAFDLLSSIIQYVPQDVMQQYLLTVFQIIMTTMQNRRKSNLYPIRTAQFLALFNGLYGGQTFVNVLNQISPGVYMTLLGQVWLPKLQGASSSKVLAKTQVIGLTRFLCDVPKLLEDDNGKQVSAQVILGIVTVLASPTFTKEAKDLPEETPMVYDATFSQLRYAVKIPDDPFSNVNDPVEFFLTSLGTLNTSHPGLLSPIIQQGLSSDPKLATSFQTMCQAKGVNLL